MSAVELSAFGPFFTVEAHDAGEVPVHPWRPMAELADGSSALADRIDSVRVSLAARMAISPADIDPRVAASVAHLGLVARILAPTVAAATCGELRISQDLRELWWQDALGGPFPLSVVLRAGERNTSAGSAVELITRGVMDQSGVSHRVLWGNIGSAVNSAARLIASSRSELTEAAREVANAYLRDQRIDDGTLRAGPDFRRRSCCLIYQLTDDRSAVCGDCVLT
ncbi:(2Fe-2S)-binding protein [Mycobacterium sp. D16Q16]|uniref:(2Fe-2S)-binding protein n=1 Tax=Mycobacterium sp. D16Q16 TaxID=1855659 RepID=UPI0009929D72|nr:(2Fe-2S)-binding protein [Mycobacterium sp. D16Q16]